MRVKNIILGIGIFVVYALVLWQGIQAFYPAPEWDDFCSFDESRKPFNIDGDKCSFSQEVESKRDSCNNVGGLFQAEYDSNGCVIDGYCDECQLNYDSSRDEYSRNIFIISLVVGFITLIVGFFVLKIEPVGSALIASGIWAVFYGTVWNWRNFGAFLKFAILLVVLVVLIWFAIRINKKRKR